MKESRKIKEYRKSLQDIARPQSEERRKVLKARRPSSAPKSTARRPQGQAEDRPGNKPQC